MATTTTLSGTIIIGEGSSTAIIPVSTPIPPPKPGDFALQFSTTDAATAPKLAVGSYITWAAAQMNLGIKDSDLPASLRNVTAAVLDLHLDSTGPFDVKVQLGTDSGGGFSSTWTPIAALPLTISDIALEVTNIP